MNAPENSFGLSQTILKQLTAALLQYPDIKNVIIYGSRARGDFRNESDIDIAIDAPTMTSQQFANLWNKLQDLPLVYQLDVLHLQSLKNELLKKKIKEEGKALSKNNLYI